MTTAADDSAVEEAFEALLAGRSVPEGAAGLAAFTEAVRASAVRPGRPSAALADLLASGLLTDQSTPSARTASSAGRAPAALRLPIRRRIAMFFTALLAKIIGAGAVAQAATGAGIVLVAFTGAGTAGVLPDTVQHQFATVADTVGVHVSDPETTGTGEDEDGTPADEQGSDDATQTGSDDKTADSTSGVTATTDDATTDDATGDDSTSDDAADDDSTGDDSAAGDDTDGSTAGTPASLSCDGSKNFGQCVSEDARKGEGHGRAVSQAAHERNEQRKSGTTASGGTTEADDDSSTEVEVEDESGDDDSASSRGNSHRGSNSGHGRKSGDDD